MLCMPRFWPMWIVRGKHLTWPPFFENQETWIGPCHDFHHFKWRLLELDGLIGTIFVIGIVGRITWSESSCIWRNDKKMLEKRRKTIEIEGEKREKRKKPKNLCASLNPKPPPLRSNSFLKTTLKKKLSKKLKKKEMSI